MSTTGVIIIAVVTFLFGMLIGVVISYNKQLESNINAGLPIVLGRENSAGLDAEDLANFLRRRMKQTDTDYFRWRYGVMAKEMEEKYFPRKGRPLYLTHLLCLISYIGLEMELRPRQKGKKTEELEKNERMYVNVQFNEFKRK